MLLVRLAAVVPVGPVAKVSPVARAEVMVPTVRIRLVRAYLVKVITAAEARVALVPLVAVVLVLLLPTQLLATWAVTGVSGASFKLLLPLPLPLLLLWVKPLALAFILQAVAAVEPVPKQVAPAVLAVAAMVIITPLLAMLRLVPQTLVAVVGDKSQTVQRHRLVVPVL